jgi:hypothetical protein
MRRAALLTILVLLALTGLAGPAAAGGPTSVLVTVPGEGRSTALYYTDTAYDRLGEAVGIDGDVQRTPDPGGLETETPITLTWLIHDVTPWRVDRVYVGPDGTTWVSTQVSVGGGSLAEVEPVWHRAGRELAAILEQVLPAGNGFEKDTVLDTRPEPAAPEPAAESTPDEDTSPLLLTGVGLAGLVAGAVGTVIRSAVRRPRDPRPEPQPAAHDELVWP